MRHRNRTLGQVLRMVRQAKGVSQNQIAKQMGLQDSTISNYERGYRTMKWDTICQICKVLEVNVALVVLLTQQEDPTVQHLVPYAMAELWKEKE